MARPGFERRFRDCLASEAFEDKINQFLRRNAATVLRESDFSESKDDNATDGEYSMKAHTLWTKYLEIIEDQLQGFQEEEELSNREFKDEVALIAEKHPFLAKLLFASWEFPQFIAMCRDYANAHEDDDTRSDSKNDGKV